MPYISVSDRDKYAMLEGEIERTKIEEKGDLEYLVFLLMKNFMRTRESRYSTLHDCTYAVQHASDEFRRRYLDIREDSALLENGDV
ncbi:MAG: hypothetical protein AABY22_10850 [Nanoarchaeota archaeon]